MFPLIARLFGNFQPARRVHSSLARVLMEGAEARAGRGPRQAHELREAALAYLRVVR